MAGDSDKMSQKQTLGKAMKDRETMRCTPLRGRTYVALGGLSGQDSEDVKVNQEDLFENRSGTDDGKRRWLVRQTRPVVRSEIRQRKSR